MFFISSVSLSIFSVGDEMKKRKKYIYLEMCNRLILQTASAKWTHMYLINVCGSENKKQKKKMEEN